MNFLKSFLILFLVALCTPKFFAQEKLPLIPYPQKVEFQKGEFIINATDLLNTLVIKKEIQGQDFSYTSNDYYETQVIRVGYNYKF